MGRQADLLMAQMASGEPHPGGLGPGARAGDGGGRTAWKTAVGEGQLAEAGADAVMRLLADPASRASMAR